MRSPPLVFRRFIALANHQDARLSPGVLRDLAGHPVLKFGDLNGIKWAEVGRAAYFLCRSITEAGVLALEGSLAAPCLYFSGGAQSRAIPTNMPIGRSVEASAAVARAIAFAALLYRTDAGDRVVDRIRRCRWEPCRDFFLAKTRRGAKFCSIKCRWAAGNADKGTRRRGG